VDVHAEKTENDIRVMVMTFNQHGSLLGPLACCLCLLWVCWEYTRVKLRLTSNFSVKFIQSIMKNWMVRNFSDNGSTEFFK